MPAGDGAAPIPAPQDAKPSAPAGDNFAQLRNLYQQAENNYRTIDSYIGRMRRREQVNGRDKPEELMMIKFRKNPFSVYFKWLGPAGNGREVTYVKDRYGNQLHTLLAAGDMPLMPAGKRLSLPPDSVFVRSNSRHPITNAGIGVIIDRFGKILDAVEKGDKRFGTIKYLGQVKRPEFENMVEGVEQTFPPGYEPDLPKGGTRFWYIDPASHLPMLLLTYDPQQREVEYYCYDRLQYPVKLDDDDFNPDVLWKPQKPQ